MKQPGRLMLGGVLALLAGCAPSTPEADGLMAARIEAAMDAKDYVMAQNFLERQIIQNPNDLRARLRLGTIYELAGRNQDAAAQYRAITFSAGGSALVLVPDGYPQPIGQVAQERLDQMRQQNRLE